VSVIPRRLRRLATPVCRPRYYSGDLNVVRARSRVEMKVVSVGGGEGDAHRGDAAAAVGFDVDGDGDGLAEQDQFRGGDADRRRAAGPVAHG
jgi:hypothetical protein